MVSKKSKKQPDFSKSVMKEIKRRDLKMRPRLYFVLGSVLLGVGLAGVVLLSMFFAHLFFFRFRVFGPHAFLRLGRLDWQPFLVNFSWLPFWLTAAGLVWGVALLRHYEISYKKSFLGLVISLVVLVVTLGFVLDRTGLSSRLSRLPPVKPFYQSHMRGKNWLVGEIVQIEDSQIVITTLDTKEVRIVWDEKTRLPFGRDFQVGQMIRVVGKWQNSTFKAEGILPGNKLGPLPRQFPPRSRQHNSGR